MWRDGMCRLWGGGGWAIGMHKWGGGGVGRSVNLKEGKGGGGGKLSL